MPMLNKPASEIDGSISGGKGAIAMQTDILEILSKLGGHDLKVAGNYIFNLTNAENNKPMIDLTKWDGSGMEEIKLWIINYLDGHIASCMEIKELEWAGEYRVLQKKIGSTDEVGELMGLIQSYCLEIYQSFEERGMFFDCSGEEENQMFAKVLGLEW